ncbi:5' nucleotidase, NT5C type [Vibrio splendidus]|nr:hypothetical protein [Vibrio splendidus]MCC4879452.1 hypothetical protein [Vibrio splendidus]
MTAKQLLIKLTGTSIICDLDDVIGDFAIPANKLMNEASGTNLTVANYLSYDYYDLHGLTREDFHKIITDNDVFLNMAVKPGAKEGLQLLIDKGFDIHIVTARGSFAFAYELTKVWLDINEIPYSKLHVVDTKIMPKSAVYETIRGACCLIDDAPYNIIDAMNSGLGVVPVIINQPWNNEFNGKDKWLTRFRNCRFNNILEFATLVEVAA